MNSLENTLRSKSIHKLSNSPTDLDQLIGASSALEMADGDTEYLKRYSERVAMEADQSDMQQKLEEERSQKELEFKKKIEDPDYLSVEKAREMAA